MSADVNRPVRLDEVPRARHVRRTAYLAFTVIVTTVVGFAFLEEVDGVRGFGMDRAEVHASAGGVTVRVHYAPVTRGGLATPLSATIERSAASGGPVTIAVTFDYFDAFLTNGVSPEPTSQTTTEHELVMVMDPPIGSTLTMDWDLVARPAGWFRRHTARFAVLGPDGGPIVSVAFSTDVRP